MFCFYGLRKRGVAFQSTAVACLFITQLFTLGDSTVATQSFAGQGGMSLTTLGIPASAIPGKARGTVVVSDSDFFETSLDADETRQLGSMKSLPGNRIEGMVVTNAKLIAEDFANIASFSGLRYLDLRDCTFEQPAEIAKVDGLSHLERLTIDGREFEQSAILRWLAVQAFTRTKLARCSTSWDEAENYRVHVTCHSRRYREIASICENLCDLRLKMSFIGEPQIVQMTADLRMVVAVQKFCDSSRASTDISSAVQLILRATGTMHVPCTLGTARSTQLNVSVSIKN